MKHFFPFLFLAAGSLFAQAPTPSHPTPEAAAAAQATPPKPPPAPPVAPTTKDVPIAPVDENEHLKALNVVYRNFMDFQKAQTAFEAAQNALKQTDAEIQNKCGGQLQERPDPTPKDQTHTRLVCQVTVPVVAPATKK